MAELPSRFTAVLWDFGGVITSSPFEAFNRMEEARGLPHDFVRRVNAANPDTNAWARFERAEINAAEFDVAFAAEARGLGHELDGREVIACLSGDIRPRMLNALDRLKQDGFVLGCITNNVAAGTGTAMALDRKRAVAVTDALSRFDHIVESSKVGIRKPDPAIYRMMCDALGLAPDECVYLDDLGINCKPAAQLGMHAIKVSGEGQALCALSAALNFPAGWPDQIVNS